MKTIVIESIKGNGQFSNKVADNMPLNKAAKKGPKKTEPVKTETPEPVAVPTAPEPTVTPEAAPQAEPAAAPNKSELREQLKEVKPALNLESTLKLVEELHRRKIQRDKLLSTISKLEEFEVAQLDDAEETDSNHFQGCELSIEDDNRNSFSTKNPYIISKVAAYINSLCLDRLAEIEGEIFLPA